MMAQELEENKEITKYEIVELLYRLTVQFIYGRIDGEELDQAYHEYLKRKTTDRTDNAESLLMRFENIIDATEGTTLYYYIMTFLIHATNRSDLCDALITNLLNEKGVEKEELVFFYQYIARLLFLGIVNTDENLDKLQDELYNRILQLYIDNISYDTEYITLNERNKELVIVITGQVLNMEHGPTKTLLDRCYILQKYLKKKILIINTAELSRFTTDYPIFNYRKGNYLSAYSRVKMIEYQGCAFDYEQFPNDRSFVKDIVKILDLVKEKKPYCIISIGGGSIIADLCSKIVPTITIGTVPSARTQTYGQFQTIGRKVNEKDQKWLDRHHMSRDHFIESLFTSAFKDQENHYLREDLGLPKNGFIAVLVGSRLDDEIDDQCLELLEKVMRKGIFIAFAGRFDRISELREKSEVFRQKSIDLGFQKDMLAVLECCDICINPKRVGGGTSVAEALFKGIPVVTQNYGDGGLGAGEGFWVEGYEQMFERTIRLSEDPEYYRSMREKAEKRAGELMDSKKEFLKILERAAECPSFQ